MIPANLKPNSNLQASEPKIIQREKRMGEAMIIIYCKDNNNTTQYHCSICSRFEVYAKKRLEFCGYQDKKPVYDKCGLPRYNLENKDYSKSVFNYAVPKMMMQHPLLGL